ncbi:hypothetical protein [Anaeromyxobacter sp. Fw109-5]|uniref:hypothetical protein n=1 Tax=Anaeromyxobacter sp. (strain Fw109-5) TaxID=404589 RepID=UPI0002EDA465|nr:hypothetical protein [Anaeromyxobacter sp. Fw109-5]
MGSAAGTARRDLMDVSVPGNEHSFGLGLRDRATDSLVLAPVAGVEWQVTDHWTVSVMPRLQFVVGGVNRLGLLVPVTIGTLGTSSDTAEPLAARPRREAHGRSRA